MVHEKKLALGIVILLILIAGGAALLIDSEKAAGFDTLPLRQAFDNINISVLIIDAIIAIVLLIVAVSAYSRVNNAKFFIIMMAFVLFALKYLLQVYDHFLVRGNLVISGMQSLFELGILLLLFLALLKK